MKNKKYAALFLIAAAVLLLFTGCNKGKYGEDTKAKSEELAVALVQTLAENNYQKAVQEFPYTSKAEKEITGPCLEGLWTGLLDEKGAFKEITGLVDEKWDKELSVAVQCAFEQGTAEFVVSFDRTVKIKSVSVR